MSKIELIHGDCLEVMKGISDGSIDMVLCDLPYGTTKCKWDVVIPFIKLWEHYNRIIKDNGCIALFGIEPFSSALRLSNLSKYKYDWYWHKDKGSNFLFANKMPMKVIETISVFYSKQPIYNAQKEINPKGPSKRHLCNNPAKISKNVKEILGRTWKEPKMNETQNYHGKGYEPDKLLPKQLLYFARDQRNRLHPTQKPVKLIEYLIKTYTNENQTVLDNCMGSGTTGVAAKNLNRNFIGIEMKLDYFQIAEKRINEATNPVQEVLPLEVS